jgi:hypothetical protein
LPALAIAVFAADTRSFEFFPSNNMELGRLAFEIDIFI